MIHLILLTNFLGIILGTLTGLIPGLHLNTLVLILLSISPIILQYLPLQSLIVLIISMSITHTFLDSLPGIYLGAPDEAQSLSVLPGHKMLLQGQGHNAVKLTIIGSFFSLILAIFLIPLLIKLVKFIFPIIKNYIGWILLFTMLFMIFKDNLRWWNLILFLMSGTLGLVVLNTPNIPNVLFPLLTGLFGFSILITSLKNKTIIPPQDINNRLHIKKSIIAKSTLGATSVGFIASFLPGFSSSQAAVLAQQFLRNLGDKGFLILIGGINTVNMTLSLVTLYVLDKARNGSIVAISKITQEFNLQLLVLSIAVILITGGIATALSIKISKIFSKLISKVNYQKLVLGVLLFITLLVFYFSSWIGLLILLVSTNIGLIASLKGIGKNHLMGVLILPVILFFLL